MSRLYQEIKAGDEIVIRESNGYSWRPDTLTKVTVTKSLKTQITVDSGRRFSKTTGKELGKGKDRHIPCIDTNINPYSLMTWEQADERDAIIAERKDTRNRAFEAKREIERIISGQTNGYGHITDRDFMNKMELALAVLKGEV